MYLKISSTARGVIPGWLSLPLCQVIFGEREMKMWVRSVDTHWVARHSCSFQGLKLSLPLSAVLKTSFQRRGDENIMSVRDLFIIHYAMTHNNQQASITECISIHMFFQTRFDHRQRPFLRNNNNEKQYSGGSISRLGLFLLPNSSLQGPVRYKLLPLYPSMADWTRFFTLVL
jgi:hypothetical protein